jgi:hypothetical protein
MPLPANHTDLTGEIINAAYLNNIDNTVNGNTTAIATKAPLASPALTGTPTAPTAAPGTNSTQLATTAFVAAAGGGGSSTLAGDTDVAITSPADGDMLVYSSSAARWKNYTRPERTFEFFGGSKTATTIQTTAWAAARAWSDSVVGGTVVFGPGIYPHMPKLELGNHMKIRGAGLRTTRLQFDASITTGSCVYNHVSINGTTDGNAYACAVEGMFLDCSLLPGWGTNPVNGITWDQLPQFGAQAVPGDNAEVTDDAMHVVRDVFVYNPPQDGVVALAMGGQYWSNVQVYGAGRYGFQPPFDSSCFNLIAGFPSKEGFFITGSPTKLVGCKAFSCGNISANRAFGQGFHIKAGPTVLDNCEAQDNWAAGIWVDGAGAAPVNLHGCILDSNGKRGVGTDPAIDISGSSKVIVDATCSERKADGTNSFQQHAVSLRADSQASLRLVHAAVGGATIGSPFQAIGTGDATLTGSIATLCDINNLQGMQFVAFAATLTPDFFAGGTIEPGVLTANLTVAAPTNGPYSKGTVARFVLKQDATGGRTITWNGIYVNTPATNTAANGYTVARFVFDGTSWVGI